MAQALATGPLPELSIATRGLAVIEYGSATCPHCAHFARDVWPPSRRTMSTRQSRFIFREYSRNNLDVAASYWRVAWRRQNYATIELLFAAQDSWAFATIPLEGSYGLAATGSARQGDRCLNDKPNGCARQNRQGCGR